MEVRGSDPDFAVVTCVTWSAGGRVLGVGTVGGFIVYSTESLLQDCGAPEEAWQTDEDESTERPCYECGDAVVEVCRRSVDGGVGILSLFGQCSVVAASGFSGGTAASTVRILDTSRPSCNGKDDTFVHARREPGGSYNDEAPMLSRDRPAAAAPLGPDGACDGCSYPAVIAEAMFSSSIAAVCYTPHFVVVALSGYVDIYGSYKIFVFDRFLNKRASFSLFPPKYSYFLQDAVAVATMWAIKSVAGRTIKWFRALLPGSYQGHVRLLTLKRVAKAPLSTFNRDAENTDNGTGSSATSRGSGREDEFKFSTAKVHSSSLRATAILQDGSRGVTIGESGTNIVLVDFTDDDHIVCRMTLQRGVTRAVNESVSLCIAPAPQLPRDETLNDWSRRERDMVALITSMGTIHLYVCDSLRQQLLYSAEKSLQPREGFPYSFSLVLPEPAISHTRNAFFVLQSAAIPRPLPQNSPLAAHNGEQSPLLGRLAHFLVETVWRDFDNTPHTSKHWPFKSNGASTSSAAAGSLTCSLLRFHYLRQGAD